LKWLDGGDDVGGGLTETADDEGDEVQCLGADALVEVQGSGDEEEDYEDDCCGH